MLGRCRTLLPRATALAGVAATLVGCAAAGFAVARPVAVAAPKAIPRMQRLDAAGMARLKADFNGASDRIRAFVLLSPTCPPCRRGVPAVQQALRGAPSTPARIYVVWEKIFPGDSLPPPRSLWGQIADPRVTHYWDPDLRVSREVERLTRERFKRRVGPGERAFDMLMVFRPGLKWEAFLPAPGYSNGPVMSVAPELQRRLIEMVR